MLPLLLIGLFFLLSCKQDPKKECPLDSSVSLSSSTDPHWNSKLSDSLTLGTQERTQQDRDLNYFHQLRAFEGAPPIIPHEVLSAESEGSRACLTCHGNGGWVERFKAFAPITPHPHFSSCRQCHVPSLTKVNFKKSEWKNEFQYPLPKPALMGGPPAMPHPLQMRENCVSCHGGPHAVKEIRSPHPERINCVQCHAPQLSVPAFQRGQP